MLEGVAFLLRLSICTNHCNCHNTRVKRFLEQEGPRALDRSPES